MSAGRPSTTTRRSPSRRSASRRRRLRLDRVGNQITTAYSTDGKQWSPAGMASFASGERYALGFLAMAGSYLEMVKATVDNISVGAP